MTGRPTAPPAATPVDARRARSRRPGRPPDPSSGSRTSRSGSRSPRGSSASVTSAMSGRSTASPSRWPAARRSASSASRAAARARPAARSSACTSRPRAGSTSTAATSRGSTGTSLRKMRRRMQMIFQDPYSSLNPRMNVGRDRQRAARHPRRRDRRPSAASGSATCSRRSGSTPTSASATRTSSPGGQRQRIGVARALALNPDLIVADEPISALDVSIQAQIINLLERLQDQFELTYLFIAHDLSVVRHISDRIAVMYLGRIVELAGSRDLNREPLHPYTVALLSAIPIPDPAIESRRRRIILRAMCRHRPHRRRAAVSTPAAGSASGSATPSAAPPRTRSCARWRPATRSPATSRRRSPARPSSSRPPGGQPPVCPGSRRRQDPGRRERSLADLPASPAVPPTSPPPGPAPRELTLGPGRR